MKGWNHEMDKGFIWVCMCGVVYAVQMLSGEDSRTVLQNLIISDSLIGISLVDRNPVLQNLTIVKCGIGVLGLGQSDPAINSCILWFNALEDLA
jgi:hypothetical protein